MSATLPPLPEPAPAVLRALVDGYFPLGEPRHVHHEGAVQVAREIAVHEAGHVVACLAQQIRVDLATINERGALAGRVSYDAPLVGRRGALLRVAGIVAYAGVAAELLGLDEGEREAAEAWPEDYFGESSAQDRETLEAYARRIGGRRPATRWRLHDWSAARGLVQRESGSVHAIAAALLRRGMVACRALERLWDANRVRVIDRGPREDVREGGA